MKLASLTVVFGALVSFAIGACSTEPVALRPASAPNVSLDVSGASMPPDARAVVSFEKSPDDGAHGLVRKYIVVRRTLPHPYFRPFRYVELPPNPAAPNEVRVADVSASPGGAYEYAVWAIAENDRTTLGEFGAMPVLSAPSRPGRMPTTFDGPRSMRIVRTELEVRLRSADPGDGRTVLLEWDPVPTPAAHHYVVMRSTKPVGPWEPFFASEVSAQSTGASGPIRMRTTLPTDEKWFFFVWIVPENGEATHAYINGQGVAVEAAWLHPSRSAVGLVLLLTIAFSLWFLWRAKHGKGGFIRRIAGVDAIEEAIGRATEMGRPVLYVPGIDEIQNIQTIASLLILGRVSEMVARYDSEIRVPCAIPLVATVGEEVVRQGFFDAGRPDAHRPQHVQWISSEQFAFCAGTNGIMLRDKPATNLFLGRFFGESLILAETGYVNRAIQIAGTAEISQLPFFIAACDYTLIGEELFAVSAYMTRDPKLLSTLKAGDAVKMLVLVALVVGSVAACIWPSAPVTSTILSFLRGAD